MSTQSIHRGDIIKNRGKISPKRISVLKSQAAVIKPLVRLGKNGLSHNQIVEINRMLSKRKLVKVKLLPGFPEKNIEETALKIASKTSSVIVTVIGNNIVLYREKTGKK